MDRIAVCLAGLALVLAHASCSDATPAPRSSADDGGTSDATSTPSPEGGVAADGGGPVLPSDAGADTSTTPCDPGPARSNVAAGVPLRTVAANAPSYSGSYIVQYGIAYALTDATMYAGPGATESTVDAGLRETLYFDHGATQFDTIATLVKRDNGVDKQEKYSTVGYFGDGGPAVALTARSCPDPKTLSPQPLLHPSGTAFVLLSTTPTGVLALTFTPQ